MKECRMGGTRPLVDTGLDWGPAELLKNASSFGLDLYLHISSTAPREYS